MAIDLVNAGTAQFASSTATFVALFPASVDSGQFLLMQISVRDTTNTPTACTYWTSVAAADSTLTGRQWLYWASGTTAYNGTSSTVGVAGTAVKGVRIYGFSGVMPTTTAWRGGQYMTSSTASMTCGEATATAASFTCLAVAAYHVNDDNDVGNFAGAVGATWTKKFQASTTLGSDGTIGVQVATISAPPVTVTTASYSMATAVPWGVRTFVLQGSATFAAATGVQAYYLYQFNLRSA